MTAAKTQKLLVILLAIASACTMALIVLNIIRGRMVPPPQEMRGTSSLRGTPPDQTDIVRGGLVGVEPKSVPVLYAAPAFTLTDSSGKTLGSADLRGKVWIADFVFTSCGSICPRMSAAMADLQRTLSQGRDWPSTRLVSISVDPDRDTPEVLRGYAKTLGAQEGQWLFLTGERSVIWPLVRNGFHLPVDEADKNSDSPILHSGKFLLIDRQGRIRGYYDGLETEGREKLLADLGRVMAEPQEAPATAPATQNAATGPSR
jgi:protein SCO1/2